MIDNILYSKLEFVCLPIPLSFFGLNYLSLLFHSFCLRLTMHTSAVPKLIHSCNNRFICWSIYFKFGNFCNRNSIYVRYKSHASHLNELVNNTGTPFLIRFSFILLFFFISSEKQNTCYNWVLFVVLYKIIYL